MKRILAPSNATESLSSRLVVQGKGSHALRHWAPKGENYLPREGVFRFLQTPPGMGMSGSSMWKPKPSFRTQPSTQKLRRAWILVCIAPILDEALCTYLSLGGSSILSQTPSNPEFCVVTWPQRPQPFICPDALLLFSWEACITPLLGWALDSKDSSRGSWPWYRNKGQTNHNF